MKRFVQLSMLFLFIAPVVYSQTTPTDSPDEILKQMRDAYRTCSSYVDTGEVNTIFIEGKGKRTNAKPFKTAFLRGSGFRYEFKDKFGADDWRIYIVSQLGFDIQSWWTIRPQVAKFETLSNALAGAVGVSSGSAAVVPFMLLPDMGMGSRFTNVRDLKLLGEEVLDGKTAYKMEFRGYKDRTATIWIDKSSSLLLKLFETAEFDTFKTESTTTYSPQINVKVDMEQLAFNPPH